MQNLYGGESIAMDPSNPRNVYFAGGCLVAWRAMGRPQVNGPGQNVGAHESDRAPEIGREIDARSTCANRPSQAETDSGFSRSDFGSWTIARSLQEARPFLLMHLGSWTAVP